MMRLLTMTGIVVNVGNSAFHALYLLSPTSNSLLLLGASIVLPIFYKISSSVVNTVYFSPEVIPVQIDENHFK